MIPVNEPLLNGNEKKYLEECIDTGWISSEGPFVKRFEESFAKKVGRKYAIAVSNGSVALDVAVAAMNIKKDDEVIMPSFTIISCASAIVRAGAIPVLLDADPITWNMDIKSLESKITKKTKAIMIVHIYGLPVDMNPIIDIAKKYDLKIIEDAAEMIGQTYCGKQCGSFGDISTFSFYPNKHVTTGEGGMVLTDDEEIANKCRSYRNLCFGEKRFVHHELGWNYRFTNLQAAIGLAQLEKLDQSIIKKREIGHKYNELLQGIDGLQFPLKSTDYAENIYWVYALVIKNELSAEEVMNLLRKEGIGTRPFFYPMHKQPVFNKMNLFNNDILPVSENIYKKGFYIPSGIGISEGQIEEVADKVRKIFN